MKVIKTIMMTVLLANFGVAQPGPPMPPAAELQKLIRRIASEVLICSDQKEVVTVVTNVVESSNERGCQTCDSLQQNPRPAILHPPHAGGLPYVRATEKYRTTICKEVWVLTFTWRGTQRSIQEEKVLWQTNQVWMLQSEWKEVAPPEE